MLKKFSSFSENVSVESVDNSLQCSPFVCSEVDNHIKTNLNTFYAQLFPYLD